MDSTILEDREVRALLSLQENAPELTDITKDRNPTIANAGQQIQKSPHQALIEQLFSPESRLRKRAYDEIKSRFGKDSAIVDSLINHARMNMDNENGVYNTVVTLKDLSREVTQPKKAEINAFCQEAQRIGDKTKEQCGALRVWLETPRT